MKFIKTLSLLMSFCMSISITPFCNAEPSAITDYNAVLLGTTFVGKTNIVNRINGKDFKEDTISTVGALFSNFSKINNENNDVTKINLWDLGGSNRYLVDMSQVYLQRSNVQIIVLDASNDGGKIRDDFNLCVKQIDKSKVKKNIIVVLNKSDLVRETIETKKNYVKSIFNDESRIITCSALMNDGIDELRNKIFEVVTVQNWTMPDPIQKPKGMTEEQKKDTSNILKGTVLGAGIAVVLAGFGYSLHKIVHKAKKSQSHIII